MADEKKTKKTDETAEETPATEEKPKRTRAKKAEPEAAAPEAAEKPKRSRKQAEETAAEPAETRMGSGKGSPEGWVCVIKPGRVMFELAGVPEPLAREAMRLAGHKLPVKTKFVVREDGQ